MYGKATGQKFEKMKQAISYGMQAMMGLCIYILHIITYEPYIISQLKVQLNKVGKHLLYTRHELPFKV